MLPWSSLQDALGSEYKLRNVPQLSVLDSLIYLVGLRLSSGIRVANTFGTEDRAVVCSDAGSKQKAIVHSVSYEAASQLRGPNKSTSRIDVSSSSCLRALLPTNQG